MFFNAVKYFFSAKHLKGYGIHSPFVFEFVRELLNGKTNYYQFNQIEIIRKKYRQNHSVIEIDDLGAGGVLKKHTRKKISSIAKNASIPKKYGELLFKIINKYKPANIVELGSSLGISTLYLSLPNNKNKIFTIEGCPAIAAIANNTFKEICLSNVDLKVGDFDDELPKVLTLLDSVDFLYVDGNHRKAPTIRYFNQCLDKSNNESIFVFDDIHWSIEMEEAWNYIYKHPLVTVSIDLFRFGIVFFRKECKRQHFVVRF